MSTVTGFTRTALAVLTLIGAVACAPENRPLEPLPAGKPSGAPALGHRQMIATAHPLASQAGLEVLRAGGSAIDAAIAAQMVLNLVEPQHSGIGGGGFLLFFDAEAGKLVAYDGRETAPASARPDMFLDADGKPREFFDAVVGGLSVGVPGLLRMLEAAHRDYGRRPWRSLFQPAIELAENGFPMSPRLHRMIAQDSYLRTSPEAAGIFYDDAGQPWPVGMLLTNRAFADTLRRIAEDGASAFYEGEIAKDIVRTVRFAARNPAFLTEADLASYRPIKRDAVCRAYRVWRVCGMPPPSSGGVATLQILGLLEPFDLSGAAPESLGAVHWIAEASRLAFADRDAYIADPDFVHVPMAALLSPAYLAERRRLIADHAAPGPVEAGQPTEVITGADMRSIRGDAAVSTTHVSVIDERGNAVAMTTTIENTFGSRLMVRGFLLNNELTDFSFVPKRDGVPVANRAEPGKRPRSSIAPTLVFDDGGHVMMTVGSPGGPQIIGYVVKTLVGVLDWDLDIQNAIDLPNFVNRNGPTELEAGTPLVALEGPLEQLGHAIVVKELESGLQGIVVTPAGLQGGADPRREGQALGD